jgi:hypothetical protein
MQFKKAVVTVTVASISPFGPTIMFVIIRNIKVVLHNYL